MVLSAQAQVPYYPRADKIPSVLPGSKIATSGSILGKGQLGFAMPLPCLANTDNCRVSSGDDQPAQCLLQRAVLT